MWRWRIRKDRHDWRVDRVMTYGWVQRSETFPSWVSACEWAQKDFEGLRGYAAALERRQQFLRYARRDDSL